MISVGLCWSPIISVCLVAAGSLLLVFSGLCRFLVIHGGVQWSSLVSAGLQPLHKSQMIFVGLCWSPVVCSVLQWCLLLSSSCCQCPIVSAGLYLSLLLSSCFLLSLVVSVVSVVLCRYLPHSGGLKWLLLISAVL